MMFKEPEKRKYVISLWKTPIRCRARLRASIPRRVLRTRTCAPAPWDLTSLDTVVREYCLEDPGPVANAVKIAGRYGIKRHVLIPAFALCWATGRRNGTTRTWSIPARSA